METGETKVKTGETKAETGETHIQTGEPKVEITESNVKRSIWPQHLAALLATLAAFSGGTVLGWSTPAIPYLQGDGRDNATFTITDEEGSWLGSLSAIGALVGAIPAGFVADQIGRKKTLLSLAVPYIISWIMFIFVSENFPLLCLARFISGLGLGAAMVVDPVYNEEVSDLKARGTTGTFCEVLMCLGVLFSFVVGSYAPYLWYNILSCMVAVLFFVTYMWMPESPMYLLMKYRYDEADKSLRWLRGAGKGRDTGIEDELNAMIKFIEDERRLKSSNDHDERWLKRFKDSIDNFSFKTSSMKAGIISIGVLLFQQLDGSNALLFYTVRFFQDAGTSMSPYDASIVSIVVQLVAACCTSRVVDIAGRKPLLLFSEICSAICLGAISVYFYFKESGSDTSSVSWMPLLILCVYGVTAEIGFGPVPWLIMAEVSPPETKGTITSLAGILYWLMVFLVTKLYTDMVSAMGIAWTFGFYAISSAIGVIFIIFIVPETKGKTREEIQYELRYGKNKHFDN